MTNLTGHGKFPNAFSHLLHTMLPKFPCLKICYWSPVWLSVTCAQQKWAWHPNRNSTHGNSEFPPLCQQHTPYGDTFIVLEGSVYPHQATLIPMQNSSITEHWADAYKDRGCCNGGTWRLLWVSREGLRTLGLILEVEHKSYVSHNPTASISSNKPVILYLWPSFLVPFLQIFLNVVNLIASAILVITYATQRTT